MSDIAVALVAAVAANGVIGADGGMPWRLSSDLRRFKALTLGHPVVMGRRTFESIGKPLPGRLNVVVSRDGGITGPDVIVAPSPTVCVIGGGTIYAAAMPAADRLHITHVEAEPGGDTHFPPIDPALWEPTAEERVPAGDRDTAPTRYVVYKRRQNAASR